jgi:3',5'-cyclic AMP phosphodiesterase CpdA
VIDIGSWRVVLLDSQVRGAAHGFLDEIQLQILASALAENPTRPVLTCLHHGPVSYCPSSGCRLHNSAALLHLLASHPNARGVICGHAHLDLERADHQVKLFVTPSTCSQVSHAQLGAPVDHDDFWASHRYDPAHYGFRILTLLPSGELISELHWVPAPGDLATEARRR